MSELNIYAQRLNELAQKTFAEYNETETAFNNAQETVREYPRRVGAVTPEYAAKSARAEANFVEAKAKWDKLRYTRSESLMQEVKTIRRELSEAAAQKYGASSESVNMQTVELLKSDILRPGEYIDLINKAKSDNNFTMARLISKYALEAADKFNGAEATLLKGAALEAAQINENPHMQAFDTAVEVFKKCLNNTRLIPHWNELTSEFIENF